MDIERLWEACLDAAPHMALDDLTNPGPALEQLLADSRALEHVRSLLPGIWGQLATHPARSVLEATLGIQVARAHTDDLLVARLLQRRSAGRFMIGDRLKASSDAEAALALLTHVALPPAQRAEERAATLALLANAQISLGQVQKGLIALEEALSIAEARGLTAALGGYLSSVGNARLVQGRVREAADYYRRAQELAERCRHPLGRAVNHGNLGLVHLALGALEAAAEELGAGLALAEELGNGNTTSLLLANLGLVHLEQGALLAARGACVRALDLAQQIGLEAGAARIELRLARIEREAGELDAADAHLARAEGLLAPRDPYRAELAVERGWVAWARGAGQRAAAALQQ
ncbi:MAG: hypothetical protein KDD82_03140, partial [Planctomycetes bacterium]|nr:hypothetical protein [Planctomycetota bacterium]